MAQHAVLSRRSTSARLATLACFGHNHPELFLFSCCYKIPCMRVRSVPSSHTLTSAPAAVGSFSCRWLKWPHQGKDWSSPGVSHLTALLTSAFLLRARAEPYTRRQRCPHTQRARVALARWSSLLFRIWRHACAEPCRHTHTTHTHHTHTPHHTHAHTHHTHTQHTPRHTHTRTHAHTHTRTTCRRGSKKVGTTTLRSSETRQCWTTYTTHTHTQPAGEALKR